MNTRHTQPNHYSAVQEQANGLCGGCLALYKQGGHYMLIGLIIRSERYGASVRLMVVEKVMQVEVFCLNRQVDDRVL